jgi:predicted phage baseplate assembly protein
MSLQTIPLDTLTWDQMVSAIRTRIPADSNGKWTLHAPVDPGVTLLELYAWLLEQRVYWMDQVPDALVLAVLALMGDAPEAAKPAVTIFRLVDDSIPPAPFRTVDGGVALRRGQENPPLIFTLNEGLTILPIEEKSPGLEKSLGLRVKGMDRTNDLRQGRAVRLLQKQEVDTEISFIFPLTQKISGASTGKFSLLIELDERSGIPPQWSRRAADVPLAAILTWFYRRSSDGALTQFSSDQVEDGTSGLRRSGIVRLPVSSDWQAEPSATASVATLYSVVLQISEARYTTSPEITRLILNVVSAHHSLPRKRTPSTDGWLLLPGNVVALTNPPAGTGLKEYPPIEDTVQVRIQERDGNFYDWTRVGNLFSSGPADRSFVVDRARGEMKFGDGLTGRLPAPFGRGPGFVEVSYQAGGGTAGMVGEDLKWVAIDPDSAAAINLIASNVIAGQEGSESETLTDTQKRVAALLHQENRAITSKDFEDLAQTTPGVGFRRAKAAIGWHPDFPCVAVPGVITVFVVPFVPRDEGGVFGAADDFVAAPQPDSGALAAANTRMEEARLLGTQVFVSGPRYRRVWLTVQAAADSGISTTIQTRIRAQFQKFLDPLSGGDEGSGWPFGDPLRPTALLREAQKILGDDGDVFSVSIRLEGMTVEQSCTDVALGAYELPQLAGVQIHVQRRVARTGGLR